MDLNDALMLEEGSRVRANITLEWPDRITEGRDYEVVLTVPLYVGKRPSLVALSPQHPEPPEPISVMIGYRNDDGRLADSSCSYFDRVST